jgi:hypothetical protein
VLLEIELAGELDGYEVAPRLRRDVAGETACLVALTVGSA